jgi:PAS domain S-box-containing protein
MSTYAGDERSSHVGARGDDALDERAPPPDGGADRYCEENESLSWLFQASGLGSWRYDVGSGRVSCSPGSRAVLGLDPDDEVLSYEQFLRCVYSADRDAVDAAMARATSETGDYAMEHRLVTKSGEVRWVMGRGRVCRRGAGGVVVVGISIDVTSRKAVEAERERLIGELAAERARLRALIDHMPAAVLMSEAPSGHVVLANRSVETVFPLPHPMLPTSSTAIFDAWHARHPDGRPVAAEERPISRALRGEAVESEDFRYRRSDGRESWIRLSSAPICDDAGAVTGAVVIASNVDREKRAEEALRASESRYRQLFESPVIGITQASVDGRITSANDMFLQTLGYTREDLAGGRLNWRELTPPEHVEGNEARIAELLETGILRPVEKAYLRADGPRVPVTVGGAMLEGSRTEFVTFILDISDRKAVEAERETLLRSLERSEERYRLAAMATEDAIYDWDLGTDCLRVQRMFGHRREIVTNAATWAEHVHPEDRDRVLDGLRRTIAGDDRHRYAEYRLRGLDGNWMVVADRAYVSRGEDGRPARIVGAMQDITARKRQQEFERQLIGIVSHDLKNPLHTISLAAELMARSEELDERTRRHVVRVRGAAERATRMIRDLLDFTRARLGAGIPIERRLVELAPIFQSLLEEVRVGHPGRAVLFHATGDCGGAFDADRLGQVLTNLVDNALKYSSDGSSVRVMLRGEVDDVVLLVHNNGPVIPAELLPRIFEPLQRGEAAFDPTGRSVGLGLYIVKHLVEAHGGRVDVRSTESGGTEFAVRLPRSAGCQAA